MKIKIAFTVWVMIIMITNSSYAQPGKTMSIDDNAASKNKANTSTNQNQILKKGYRAILTTNLFRNLREKNSARELFLISDQKKAFLIMDKKTVAPWA